MLFWLVCYGAIELIFLLVHQNLEAKIHREAFRWSDKNEGHQRLSRDAEALSRRNSSLLFVRKASEAPLCGIGEGTNGPFQFRT